MKRKLFLSVLALLFFSLVGFLLYHSQYRDRWQCRKFLIGMEKEGPPNIKLEYVEFNQEDQEFYCRYKIKEKYGYTKEHMQKFLLVKALAERLLAESGEIPKTYKICIQIRAGSPSESIGFYNQDFSNDLEGKVEMGGYQLFRVYIGVPCFLSELSALSDVKILHLETLVRIDDLSGLRNMGELQFVSQRCQKNNSISLPFTDKDIEKIKAMYPGCIVKTERYYY